MPRSKHPLRVVLPMRITDIMLESIQVEAKRLKVRPHDIARIALGIGLKALLESEQFAKEILKNDL